jgi:cell wall-associated NlpC family hydrolase
MSEKVRPAKKTMIVALAACAALLVVFTPTGLYAQPSGDIASKSQQAAQIAQEIDTLDKEMAVATEAYNRVKIDLDSITDKVEETEKRLHEIKQSLRKRRGLLNERCASMYKQGRTSMLEVLLETKDFSEFLEKADYVSRVARSDADMIDRIKTTRDSVQALENELSEERRQQLGLVSQEEAKKSQIEMKLGERRVLLNSVNQDIQRMLADQQQVQRASDTALSKEAQDALVTAPDGGLAKTALRYLGVPYHWAGAGPGQCPTGEHRICFDCSGLTQYVYKLFGISIPHNAAMQFNRGVKITLQQARPGDLVYFGMPPHHVGMYLGNDMFVHAPQTGDVVKVTRLSSRKDLSGITRFTK